MLAHVFRRKRPAFTIGAFSTTTKPVLRIMTTQDNADDDANDAIF
jgi:hypothetical protein